MAFGPFCLQTPECPQHRFKHMTPQPVGLPTRPASGCGSGLRHGTAGSPSTPAETSSLSYGRVLHFQLLPTPPHGDAVTFCFRPENVCLKGTCTPLTLRALRRTIPPLRRWSLTSISSLPSCASIQINFYQISFYTSP